MSVDVRPAAVLAVVLVLAVGSVTATAAAADASVAPETACRDVQDTRVVAAFSDGTRLQSAQQLYVGTEFAVFVCSDGAAELRETAWTLDESTSGFETVETDRYSARVRVTEANGTVSLAKAVPEKEAGGPRYTVADGTGVRTRVGDDTRTLTFPSESAAERYRTAEARYVESAGRLSNATTAVRGATEALGTDSFEPVHAGALDAFESSPLVERHRALEAAVFEAGVGGDDDAAELLVAVNRGQSERLDASRSALEAYRGELRGRLSGARTGILLSLLGGVVGGLVFGGGVGYRLANRELEKVAYDKQLTATSKYSVRQLAVPVGVGASLVVATVVGLAVSGWLDAFVEVFL